MTRRRPPTPPFATDASSDHAYSRRWWTLAVLCLSLVLVVVANTVLNVALPTLVQELGATATDLQWIVDSYALVFAGLLLTTGAVGDRYGRKGALQIGLGLFGVATTASAFATSAQQLIATRALMGVAAAFVMPATLSLLTSVFPPRERGRAIGIWAGFAGAGAALGPVAGGWLLEHFWWGAVFLVNVPIVTLALVAGWWLVPTSRDPGHTAFDPLGALLSIGALGALVYGVIEGPNYGWTDPIVLGAFALAAIFGTSFVHWELRIDHPMLDLRMVRDPRFSAASGAIALVFLVMFGLFFLLTQYLQVVLGYSPLEAGVRTLPMAIGLLVFSPMGARLVERFGTKAVVGWGLMLVSFGLLLAAQLDPHSSYANLVVALIVLSIGMSFSTAPSTASIMASMPPGKAGVGSAVNDTTRELGGAIGVAVLGSITISSYSSSLVSAAPDVPPRALEAASESVGAAAQIGSELGPSGAALATAANQAFTDAMGLSFMVGAAVALVAAALVWRYLPSRVEDGAEIDSPRVAEAHPQPVVHADRSA